MELTGVVAVVDHLARDNQLVLVVDRDLQVVSGNALTILRQKPRIRIRLRELRLAALIQPVEISLGLCAFGHQRGQLLSDVTAITIAAAPILPCRRMPCLCCVVGVERAAVSLDVLVDRRELLGEALARPDASLAGIAVEEGAIDRHQRSTHQARLARQQYELPVGCLQRRPIVLAEVPDRPVAGRQPPE